MPVAAATVAPVHVAGFEEHVPRGARVAVRVERTRPVGAVAACADERTEAAVARSGEENTIAVRLARYLVTHYTVLGSP